MNPTTQTCSRCSNALEDDIWTICSSCDEKATQENEARRQQELIHNRDKEYARAIVRIDRSINEITPTRFRSTAISHPDFNATLWRKIESWMPTQERPWLGLVGNTGDSKTRCAFLLLELIAKSLIRLPETAQGNAHVPSLMAASSYRIAEAVAAKASEQRDAATKFLSDLRDANVLLIDDLGKQRTSPAVVAELFALIDHRHAENLPMIWTANITPEAMVAGMPDDIAAPLAGRLIECTTLVFTS